MAPPERVERAERRVEENPRGWGSVLAASRRRAVMAAGRDVALHASTREIGVEGSVRRGVVGA
jgi:hypothetical protein